MAKKKKEEIVYEEESAPVAVVEEGYAPVVITEDGSYEIPGIDGLMAGDLQIPRRSIVHPGSNKNQKGIPDGTFVSSLDDNDVKTSVNGYLLQAVRGRIWFKQGEDKPSCGSDNGRVPSGRFEHPICDTCTVKNPKTRREDPVCKLAKWSKDETGSTKPPICSATWNFLIYDLDEGMPFWMSFSKTGWKPANRLFTSLLINIERTKRPLPCCAGFELGMNLVETGSKSYYVPVFKEIKPLSTEDYLDAQLMFARFQSEKISEEPVAKTGSDDDDENAPF